MTLLAVIIYELQRPKVYHNSLWPDELAALARTADRQQQEAAFVVVSRRPRRDELQQHDSALFELISLAVARISVRSNSLTSVIHCVPRHRQQEDRKHVAA